MIYVVTRHDHAHTVEPLLRVAENGLADIRLLAYGDLFAERVAPVGHYIFTDFDRLTSYELQVAEAIARHIEQAAPDVRILNRPVGALERYPLLRKLARMGLNDFSAVRIDAGEMPARYPVFIRLEDDCKYPDTGLLHSQQELTDAIDALQRAGLPLKRRIAVEYCAEPGADGHFRKYGAFRVGDRLVPHHLMLRTDWYVKRGSNPRPPPGADDPHHEERTAYLRSFPHGEAVMERFKLANIDFGRIDYAIVGGRLQTYEINTNPTIPPLWFEAEGVADVRRVTRALFRKRLVGALNLLDTPFSGPEAVRFKLPEPRLQTFRPIREGKKKDKKHKMRGATEPTAPSDPTPSSATQPK